MKKEQKWVIIETPSEVLATINPEHLKMKEIDFQIQKFWINQLIDRYLAHLREKEKEGCPSLPNETQPSNLTKKAYES